MRKLCEVEAARRVINGESLLCEGVAGTGKTTYIQGLVQELRALGRTVAIISKTHTASQRAGGVTADHWVRRHILHGCAVADCVWIDECFQLETELWAQLNKLSGRQWILSGDAHQFAPLFDSWRGAPVAEDAFQRSRLLLTLCGCNRLTLTTCRRSDGELFAWYSSLIRGGSRYELPLSACWRARASLWRGPRSTTCV
jgi:hypothetical protein